MVDLGYEGNTCGKCKSTANIMRWSAGYVRWPPSWQCKCGHDNTLNWSGMGQFPFSKPDQIIG